MLVPEIYEELYGRVLDGAIKTFLDRGYVLLETHRERKSRRLVFVRGSQQKQVIVDEVTAGIASSGLDKLR